MRKANEPIASTSADLGNLGILPSELLAHILTFVDPKTVGSIKATNSSFYNFVHFIFPHVLKLRNQVNQQQLQIVNSEIEQCQAKIKSLEQLVATENNKMNSLLTRRIILVSNNLTIRMQNYIRDYQKLREEYLPKLKEFRQVLSNTPADIRKKTAANFILDLQNPANFSRLSSDNIRRFSFEFLLFISSIYCLIATWALPKERDQDTKEKIISFFSLGYFLISFIAVYMSFILHIKTMNDHNSIFNIKKDIENDFFSLIEECDNVRSKSEKSIKTVSDMIEYLKELEIKLLEDPKEIMIDCEKIIEDLKKLPKIKQIYTLEDQEIISCQENLNHLFEEFDRINDFIDSYFATSKQPSDQVAINIFEEKQKQSKKGKKPAIEVIDSDDDDENTPSDHTHLLELQF